MTVVIGNDWYVMFNDPLFRQGWVEHALGIPRDQALVDRDLFYSYGRMLAAESKLPLPAVATHLTEEMRRVVHAVPSFVELMVYSNYAEKIGLKRNM